MSIFAKMFCNMVILKKFVFSQEKKLWTSKYHFLKSIFDNNMHIYHDRYVFCVKNKLFKDDTKKSIAPFSKKYRHFEDYHPEKRIYIKNTSFICHIFTIVNICIWLLKINFLKMIFRSAQFLFLRKQRLFKITILRSSFLNKNKGFIYHIFT